MDGREGKTVSTTGEVDEGADSGYPRGLVARVRRRYGGWRRGAEGTRGSEEAGESYTAFSRGQNDLLVDAAGHGAEDMSMGLEHWAKR